MGDKDQESEVSEAGEEDVVDKAPPVFVPEDGDTTLGRRHPKWLVPVIIAVVAVVLVVSGLVCWHLVGSRRHDSALKSCNQAAKSL